MSTGKNLETITEEEFQNALNEMMLDSAAEALSKEDRQNALYDLQAIAAVRPNAEDIIRSYNPGLYRFYIEEKG